MDPVYLLTLFIIFFLFLTCLHINAGMCWTLHRGHQFDQWTNVLVNDRIIRHGEC